MLRHAITSTYILKGPKWAGKNVVGATFFASYTKEGKGVRFTFPLNDFDVKEQMLVKIGFVDNNGKSVPKTVEVLGDNIMDPKTLVTRVIGDEIIVYCNPGYRINVRTGEVSEHHLSTLDLTMGKANKFPQSLNPKLSGNTLPDFSFTTVKKNLSMFACLNGKFIEQIRRHAVKMRKSKNYGLKIQSKVERPSQSDTTPNQQVEVGGSEAVV